MFAALPLERDPLKLADLPHDFQLFVVYAGMLTAIVLAFWLVLSPILGQRRGLGDTPKLAKVGFLFAVAVGALAYLVYQEREMP